MVGVTDEDRETLAAAVLGMIVWCKPSTVKKLILLGREELDPAEFKALLVAVQTIVGDGPNEWKNNLKVLAKYYILLTAHLDLDDEPIQFYLDKLERM